RDGHVTGVQTCALPISAWRCPFNPATRLKMLRANLYRGNYYRTLGINAFLGRLTTDADEDVSPYPVVLSYGFWQRAFGGRRDVRSEERRVGKGGGWGWV